MLHRACSRGDRVPNAGLEFFDAQNASARIRTIRRVNALTKAAQAPDDPNEVPAKIQHLRSLTLEAGVCRDRVCQDRFDPEEWREVSFHLPTPLVFLLLDATLVFLDGVADSARTPPT